MGDEPKRLLQHWRVVGRASLDAELCRVDIAVLWSVLQMINSETGRAFTSLERIAERAQVSVRSVPRSLQRLCTGGYLVKRPERGANRSSIYSAGDPDQFVTDESDTDEPVSVESVTDGSAGATLTDSSGYTLTDPSDISASNQLHSPASLLSAVPSRFDEFWKQYPRKEAKVKAQEVWARKRLDRQADAIIANVAARVADPRQWTDPQFIPLPTSYLNQRRWEDELPASLTPAPPVGRLPRETNADAINAESMRRLGMTP